MEIKTKQEYQNLENEYCQVPLRQWGTFLRHDFGPKPTALQPHHVVLNFCNPPLPWTQSLSPFPVGYGGCQGEQSLVGKYKLSIFKILEASKAPFLAHFFASHPVQLGSPGSKKHHLPSFGP